MPIERYTSKKQDRIIMPTYTTYNSSIIQKIKDPVAGFVWVYLHTMPVDWKIIKTQVQKALKIGEKKLNRAFAYLHRCNLLRYDIKKGPDGKIISHDIWILNGDAFCEPLEEKMTHTAKVSNLPSVSREAPQKVIHRPTTHIDDTPKQPEPIRGEYSMSLCGPVRPSKTPCTADVQPVHKNSSTSGPSSSAVHPVRKAELHITHTTQRSKDKKCTNPPPGKKQLSFFDVDWNHDERLIHFRKFYEAYPRKKHPQRAAQFWLKHNLDPCLPILLKSLERDLASNPKWQHKAYVPYPLTYLSQQLKLPPKEMAWEKALAKAIRRDLSDPLVEYAFLLVGSWEMSHGSEDSVRRKFKSAYQSGLELLSQNKPLFTLPAPKLPPLRDKKDPPLADPKLIRENIRNIFKIIGKHPHNYQFKEH